MRRPSQSSLIALPILHYTDLSGRYIYHRLSGYLLLTLFLVTVFIASLTSYEGRVLNLKPWGVGLVGELAVAGEPVI